jgi:Tol biopolymer transport system component
VSDIWVVRRPTTEDPFGMPILLSEISSPDGEISSSVSPDGCTLLIASDRDGTRGGRDLLVASRPTCSHEEPFRRPERITQLGGPTDEWTPYLTFDGRSLYFARKSAVSASSDLDLHVARRVNSAAPFGEPEPLEELNTSTLEWGPSLTADGLALYFASGRDMGSNDIFRATRATTSQRFGTPQPVAQLNSVDDDRDPQVSPDGRTVYFSSNRNGGDYEIYVSTQDG